MGGGYSVRSMVGVGVLMLLLALFGSWFGANVLTDAGPSKAEVNQTVLTGVVDGLTKNCEVNLKYRRQSRQRARANDLALKLQVAANEALINVVNELTATGSTLESIVVLGHKLDRVNEQLNDVRAQTTQLLPLPDCSQYSTVLEEAQP